MNTPTTVDFETKKIENRPMYPPVPVGVAIREPGGRAEYLAWGHPTKNNADIATARRRLKDAYDSGPVLFHNGGFDMDVAQCHLGLPLPRQPEDSQFTMFLYNPHERELKLKSLAEKYLHMPPTERDELQEWILENVPDAKRKKTKWGEFISEAPGDLVGEYAIGDVERTFGLYHKYQPKIIKRGMMEAYQRETAIVPILMDMQRTGVRVHVGRTKKFLSAFQKLHAFLDKKIRRRLGVGEDFNMNSGPQLAAALVFAKKLDKIVKTKTGRVSTKIDVLTENCNDKKLLKMMAVHSVCQKYITSFLVPWLEQAEKTGGRLLPTFNQVRGRDEERGGTRSGRLSCSNPNLQQVSSNVEESKNRDTLLILQAMLKDMYGLHFVGLRDLIIPDEGMVMICTDYNQQELRILAHYEQDVLMRAYLDDPTLDIHEYCRQLIYKATSVLYERKYVKITVFGIIYGMGVKGLSEKLKIPYAEAQELRDHIYDAIPGIKGLMKDLKRLARRDEPLITWGGRQYYCEEPKYDEDREDWVSYEYKMLNYKVQPSAADCTKQGMIQVHQRVPEARIAIQVHDELVCMAPDKSYAPRIAAAMCDVKFRVPMVADSKCSTKSWARAA